MRQYTWTHICANSVSLARLDRMYAFKHHLNIFFNCGIIPVSFSDHRLVLCYVFINSIKSKSAYWHFNTALLNDSHLHFLCFFWLTLRSEKHTFKILQRWWEYGKAQIKQLCQQ